MGLIFASLFACINFSKSLHFLSMFLMLFTLVLYIKIVHVTIILQMLSATCYGIGIPLYRVNSCIVVDVGLTASGKEELSEFINYNDFS